MAKRNANGRVSAMTWEILKPSDLPQIEKRQPSDDAASRENSGCVVYTYDESGLTHTAAEPPVEYAYMYASGHFAPDGCETADEEKRKT
jgi:hypothetical protein